ncbi:hypothetical protein LJY25_00920 [Hymenobacter sp. BT175]|uniref:hypothetical protein n=1 Tax=Hymenobacter translucens TaxID=2886507 RepID=UPI001D0E1AB5|nr:hypothetical protein [Hymenobacter translucens]MCC2544991.1 hypothetical protein [Hymenobacter translucens]
MKLLLRILLALVVLLVVSGIGGYFYFRNKFEPPVNQLVVSRLPATLPFVWAGDTTVPHQATLVPVRLPGCPRTCYLQFDTGTPFTLLYAKSLTALRSRYPATQAHLAAPADTVKNLTLQLGSAQVLARRLPVFPHGGAAEVPADTATAFIIGTLGTDIMEGRVLVIDYPNQRLTLAQSLPDSLGHGAAFAPLEFKGRRVLVTSELQGKPVQMLFDSGTSAYSLVTSQSEWDRLARPAAPVQKLNVNSWGKTLTSYTAATAASLKMGGAVVPLGTVTHIEGMSLPQRLLTQFSGMGGLLGNEPFAGRTIILDVAGSRFGVR